MGAGWRLLVDECMEPRIAHLLRAENVDARHVQDVPQLGKGADDDSDILPYLKNEDVILITNNFLDFDDIGYEDHEGILLDYHGQRTADEYVAAILRIIDQYPNRDGLRHREPLDDWTVPSGE